MAANVLKAILTILTGMVAVQASYAAVCNITCTALPSSLLCGPDRGSNASQILLSFTQVKLKGYLEINVLAEIPDDSLQLKSVPPFCQLNGAQEIDVVYRRTRPSVTIAPTVFTSTSDTRSLKVHGPVHLDGLLQAMQGLEALLTVSANLTKPITGLARLKNIILDNTLWRPNAKSDPGLLAWLPTLMSAKFVGGRIGRLQKGDFVGLPELRYLYLVQCEVSALDADTFEMLGESRLRYLSLEGNAIDKLPRRAFERVGGSLEQLRLARNEIQVIDPEAFAGLTALEQLDLSSNRLKLLAPESFAGLKRLRSLDLGANPMLIVFSGVDSHTTSGSRIFCQLESLATMNLDQTTGLDCREFASAKVRIITILQRMRRRRVLSCNWNTGSWCTKQLQMQPLQEEQQVASPSVVQQDQRPMPNLLLLMVLGSVSLAHLVVVLIIVALCLRFGARRSSHRCSLSRSAAAAARAIDIGDGDENRGCGAYSLAEGSGAGSGGVGGGRRDSLVASHLDSAAAVLVSFQTKNLSDDDADDTYTREKICYQFNEDA